MVGIARTTLLTGSTGFIGQYVLRELLTRGERVLVMLRRPLAASRMRLTNIAAPLGMCIDSAVASGQLVIVEGELPDKLPQNIGTRVDQILHSAACLQVEDNEDGEPFATNVDGVKGLANWAQVNNVGVFHFVSTAYTCGREADIALEQFHTPLPRFLTAYEHSKWLAEKLLLEWSERTGSALTILRPSLVIGDSQTGYTTQYGGFYKVARMVQVLKTIFQSPNQHGEVILPMRIPADPQACQNLVPVDYVARVIAEIVLNPQVREGIFHITNPDPPTNDTVKQWLEDYFQVTGGHFVDRVDHSTSESPAEDMFMHLNELILQQMHFVPQFDCRNTAGVLVSNLAGPLLDHENVFRMLRYADSTRWGHQARAAS